jgi:hypothetical protein
MRFAKLNHMSIITLFAIAFIVIYLYYTISDVKKIHSEVKKMGQDIEKLNQSITNITTSILPMLTFPSAPVASASQSQHTASIPSIPTQQQAPSVQVVQPQQTYNDVYQEDDETSVGSHELTKIMETIEVDDVPIENGDDSAIDIDADDSVAKFDIDVSTVVVAEESHVQQGQIVDIGSLSAEDLKKAPYNDIRKYCKLNNIDDKGSKEILIYRIKNPPKP